MRTRASRRRQQVAREALLDSPAWVESLRRRVGSIISGDDWSALVGSMARYRDRWNVGTDGDPLGPVPDDYEWEGAAQRDRLVHDLQTAATLSAPAEAIVTHCCHRASCQRGTACALCPQLSLQPGSDLHKHRVGGETRTRFQPLETLGRPGNMWNPEGAVRDSLDTKVWTLSPRPLWPVVGRRMFPLPR